MRFIHAKTLVRERTFFIEDFSDRIIPPYAILSHRWNRGQEITYANHNLGELQLLAGYQKILGTCMRSLSVWYLRTFFAFGFSKADWATSHVVWS